MKIAVFGLGYVGMVTAACLADKGHSILGVETDPEKLDRLNRGQSPVVEDGLNELVRGGIQNGRIRVYDRGDRAVRESDMAMICVGTPGRADGGLDTGFVKKVAEEKKAALVDLHAASGELFEKIGEAESGKMSNDPADRTHFNEPGARAMAELIIKQLPGVEPAIKPCLKEKDG